MGIITWLCVRATALLSFDIVILCLAPECITMVQCVAYIQDLCMTLTFDLNIKNYISIMNLSRARSSFLFDIGILNFDILVYNHETK